MMLENGSGERLLVKAEPLGLAEEISNTIVEIVRVVTLIGG